MLEILEEHEPRRIALSFDVGGTFTDFVIVDLDSGELISRHKVLTNSQYPARGVLQGWEDLLEEGAFTAGEVNLAVHSTTLVTNAIIERKGARTALLATKGFRDLLEIGREQMYDIYDLFAPPPEPLIPRPLRFDIPERTTATGEILTEPDNEAISQVIAQLRDQGIESVAIAFLHSYRNPANELAVAEAVQRALPDATVSLSSSTAPIAGEYERTSTVTADAFTKPGVHRYVNDLVTSLTEGGMDCVLHMVLSSGEIVSAGSATERPIRLLESGPASGAVAAAFFGSISGHPDVLSLDMGGTTAKACVIENGHPERAQMLEAARVRRFMKGSGLPVVAPVVDLIEIGAGGGSIAHRDKLGLLKVGPESAGADPGPACYGLGGTQPTVSDANLVLGYLNPSYFLGGSITLRADRAKTAINELADELGLTLEETAWGIHRVVNENMTAAARVHIIERNRDPRSLATIAFGGAGPAHAVAVARLLGSPAVVLPSGAGVASALGALVAPIAFTAGRTLMTRIDQTNWSEINAIYEQLRDEAANEVVGAGIDRSDVSFHRWAEMRLEGQYHEIDVRLPDGRLDASSVSAIEGAFSDAYAERYGRVLQGLPIEALHWRLTATGPASPVQLKQQPQSDDLVEVALKERRPVYFPDGGYRETPVYDRDRFRPGMTFTGPAVIEEREATAVIWPGDTARVDEYLSIVVTLNGNDESSRES